MFTKLDMIYNQLVLTNYFEFRYNDVISDVTGTSFLVKPALELVSTITRAFFLRSSPNLVESMLYEWRRTQ